MCAGACPYKTRVFFWGALVLRMRGARRSKPVCGDTEKQALHRHEQGLVPATGPPVSIDNTVCTFGLGVDRICLRTLHKQCPAAEYDPRSFGAAVVQLLRPKCTCLVFSSGMGVCVGARSYLDAHLGVTDLINAIKLCGFSGVRMTGFLVRNVVGSMKLGKRICLAQMAQAATVPTMYNPDLFPGLRCKPVPNESCSALVYATGAVVLTGCSSAEACIGLGSVVYDLCIRHCVDGKEERSKTMVGRGDPGLNKRALTCEMEHMMCSAPASKQARKRHRRAIDGACVEKARESAPVLLHSEDAWDDPAELCGLAEQRSFEEAMVDMSARSAGIAALRSAT